MAAEVVVAVDKPELQELALRRHRLRDLGVGAVERHGVVEGLLAVFHAARPAEARVVVNVRASEDVCLEVVQLKDPLELGEALLHDVRALPRVRQHVLAHRLQHLAALVAAVFVVPEDLQHAVERVGEVEASVAGLLVLHVLQLPSGVRHLDQLDRLVVVEVDVRNGEEVVVAAVLPVVLDHVPPEFEEFPEEEVLGYLREFCHDVLCWLVVG